MVPVSDGVSVRRAQGVFHVRREFHTCAGLSLCEAAAVSGELRGS